MPLAKLGEQRGCRFLLSPRPCWPAPQVLSHRASLPGLARGSCTEPQVQQGQEQRSGSRGGRPASAFPSLSCRAPAKPVRASRDTASGRAGTGRAPRCLPEVGGPVPSAAQATAKGHGGPSARHLRLRLLPAVRTGAAAGGSSRLSGTGGAQGALLRPSSNLQLVFSPFPAPSLASLCPDLAEGPPLPRFPSPRQALPEETRLRPAQGAGRARSTPVRRQKCFAMRALLCQVTLLLYLFF